MQTTAYLPHPASPDDTTLAHRRETENTWPRTLGAALALGLIILLAAFLRFYRLGADSIGNEYYAATIKSMLTSWHNFFYASFEPGGSVTVDKPPLGFWIQAASAAIFGLSGFALALPQALAGMLSVPLMYYLVRRTFGVGAGLLAALALAVTPVAVATDRNNTIDSTLVFVLLLAAWAFIAATETGRLRYLLLGAVLVGLGFNIKMLQAYLPLPAFYALYLIGSKPGFVRRVFNSALATGVLLALSLSWAVAVDLTPPDQRPYIGSSKNNTVMELIIGHNGLARLWPGGQRIFDDGLRGDSSPQPGNGQSFAPPPGPPQAAGRVISIDGRTLRIRGRDGEHTVEVADNATVTAWDGTSLSLDDVKLDSPLAVWGEWNADRSRLTATQLRPGLPPGPPPAPGNAPGAPPPQDAGGPGGAPPAGRPGFSKEIGEPGGLRLFAQPLVDQASWLVPLAFIGALAAVFRDRLRYPLSARHSALILWGLWLITEVVFFSVANLFHTYYLIMLAPPLAALVGIGVSALWQTYRERAWIGTALIVLALGLTAAFQVIVLRQYPDQRGMLIPLIAIATLLSAGALVLTRRINLIPPAALGLGLAALLIAPLAWSAISALDLNPNVSLPNAGPPTADEQNADGQPPRGAGNRESRAQPLIDYLSPRTEDTLYLVATLNARDASPLIIETGRPVLTFGGFSGGDQIIGADELAELVTTGRLRYVWIAPEEMRRQHADLLNWIEGNCQVEAWPGSEQLAGPPNRPGTGPGDAPRQLYSCGPSAS